MPFVTEELWHAMGDRPYELIVAQWPAPNAKVDPVAKADIPALIDIISGIRSQRLDTGFRPADIIPISPVRGSVEQLVRLNKYKDILGRMARVKPSKIEITGYDGGAVWSIEGVDQYELTDADQTSIVAAQFVLKDLTVLGSTEGFIDIAAEQARLSKLAAAAEKERDSLAARLANPAFAERAKPEAVEKARADHEAKSAEAERLRAALDRLG
jgi:valyl-tRNA synthetase